jgi:hypothetical protein
MICVKFSIVMMGGFGMVHRLYPLEREVFDRLVLPLIAGHWKKAGRPPSVVHYDFFCGVLYVLGRGTRVYTRYKRWGESGFFWRLRDHLQSLKKLCVDVVFAGGSLIPFHRHGSGALKK